MPCDNRGMSTIYEHIPHPHIELRKRSGPVKVKDVTQVDSPNAVSRFNARFGLRITLVVGTMWAAYIFAVLAFYGLPQAIKGGASSTVLWTSSEFIQLVLLPIIIVGQNIQAAASDKRAEETYKDAEAVLKEAEEIQKHLLAQDEAISEIVARLEKLVGPPAS